MKKNLKFLVKSILAGIMIGIGNYFFYGYFMDN